MTITLDLRRKRLCHACGRERRAVRGIKLVTQTVYQCSDCDGAIPVTVAQTTRRLPQRSPPCKCFAIYLRPRPYGRVKRFPSARSRCCLQI